MGLNWTATQTRANKSDKMSKMFTATFNDKQMF